MTEAIVIAIKCPLKFYDGLSRRVSEYTLQETSGYDGHR